MNFYFFLLWKKKIKYLITVKIKNNFSSHDSDTGPTILTLIKVFFLDLLTDRAVMSILGLLLDDQVTVIAKKVWFLIY